MKSPVDVAGPVQHVNILRHLIPEEGDFPNNGLLPLMIYRNALQLPLNDRDKTVIETFESNGWINAWTNGIYNYHHYHSNTHEVLGIIQGSVRVQFGGPSGISLLLEEKDVVIIPAGVAHKSLSDDDEVVVVGAYPAGHTYDMNYGKKHERPRADSNIRNTPLPETDPVYGINGPLIKNWVATPEKYDDDL